ncbi:MAG: 4-alpha-glucanotransferase [Gammaproteobacteria bacterium]|nr:4-alpha-glucanotransferase [Gammaproteobacteria bacterium]
MNARPKLRNMGTSLSDTRCAGVCLHVTALPGRYGIGELGQSAFAFIDELKAMGLQLWQFLPLGPTGYGDSPYQPLSSFAGNEMLIDIGELIRLKLISEAEAKPLTQLPTSAVDYGRLIPLKTTLLKKAAERFEMRASTQLKTACDAFCNDHDQAWLRNYALYRTLKTLHGEKAWPHWPRRYARRYLRSLRRIEREYAAAMQTVRIAQFLFHHQCSAVKRYAADNGIALFGDVPIYIALDSADAWSQQEIIRVDRDGRPGFVSGVPPDYYSKDGQLWGNPLYDWDYHQRNRYAWWIDRFRHAMRYTDLVRVDHFRGFEAYWAVPADATTARSGTWERGPGYALFDALSDALGSLPIVVENLGVITAEVEALREHYDMPGMVILQFDASKKDFDPDQIDTNNVVYTGGHDNDTTQGWFNGGPGDIRTRAEVKQEQRIILEKTGGSAATIHWDLIRLTFGCDGRIAIVPMQDFLGLGSEARFNTPATESGNWRWRLLDEQLTLKLREQVCRAVAEGARCSPATCFKR